MQFVDEEELEEIYSTIAFEYENLGEYGNALTFLNKALNKSPESEALLLKSAFATKWISAWKMLSFSFITTLKNTPTALLPGLILASPITTSNITKKQLILLNMSWPSTTNTLQPI